MKRVAFKMFLKPGFADEYKRRHALIWPELQQLLISDGIEEYYIFLDEETNELFAFLKKKVNPQPDSRANNEVVKKWWAYMKDIMNTNADNSPLKTELQEVFSLR